MISKIVKVIVSILIGWPVSMPNDVYDVLKENKIKYEIREEMPIKGAYGMYMFKSGTILISAEIESSGLQLKYVVAHELVHKYRYENGLWTGDIIFEELIAVYGTEKMSKHIGFGRISLNEKKTMENLCRLNGFKMPVITDELLNLIHKEVNKTLTFIP